MNSLILEKSKIIDRFKMKENYTFFLLLQENLPDINVGSLIFIDNQEYIVKEIIFGNRNRVGIKVIKNEY